jgi:hypothetical protein
MAFSDGRTAKILVERYSFTDQQGRIWMKKERTRPSAPLVPSQTVSHPASKPTIIWASVAVAAAVFIIVATQWGNIGKWLRKSSPAHYTDSSASWEAHTFPGTGMTVDLPGDPDQLKAPITGEESNYIRDAQAYTKEYENLECMMMYLLANGGRALDAEGGARGGMEELKKEPGVVGLDYHITTPYPGLASISGTCIYLGRVATVEGVVRTKGSKLWTIFTISRTDDAEARAAAKRIISSARFE